MTEPFVSIIVLNWNGIEDTILCVKSILEISYKNYKITVIDNGSEQDDSIRLKKIFGSKIDIYRLNKNLGFTGGCNYGLKVSQKYSPDFFLLLNNDTTVNPRFLEYLVKSASQNSLIGIVSPLIYDFYDHNKVVFSGGKFNWMTAKFAHKTDVPQTQRKEIFVTGCSMLISKKIVEKIGFLDERFFAYFEDVAYCFKARSFNFLCICEPRSVIYHKVSASSRKVSYLRTYLMSRNRALFVNSYLPKIYKFYFFMFNIVKLIFVSIYFTLTKQMKRRSAYFMGFNDGTLNRGGIPNL